MQDSAFPKSEGKKQFVREMFDAIAPRYDLLNRLLSGGIDQLWRRRAVRLVTSGRPQRVLDVATGTADLAIMAADEGVSSVVGVDIAEEMLQIGRDKISRRGYDAIVELRHGDAEKLPFSDDQFDAAMVAFGVRNFENLEKGLSQIHRILRPGGRIVVLEFSRPRRFPIRQLYGFYGRYILPVIGRFISGDERAYTYLPESIQDFPDGIRFLDELRKVGFDEVIVVPLTFGIASIYSGKVSTV